MRRASRSRLARDRVARRSRDGVVEAASLAEGFAMTSALLRSARDAITERLSPSERALLRDRLCVEVPEPRHAVAHACGEGECLRTTLDQHEAVAAVERRRRRSRRPRAP